MPNPESRRIAARTRAREKLASMADEEDRTITIAALTDPDAQPLDAKNLDRMDPTSAADADDLNLRLRSPGWMRPSV
jgi:hypothetical protein